ncbi:MAG: NUDIX domain-containing protein [Pseudomonadota bacterium]
MSEQFEVFNDQGALLGRKPRDEVHRLGFWHKSAQVFVFNSGGHLLLQRRSEHKDLYAGLWDYSVGEHLQPGESYLDGARRGLWEELRIADVCLITLGDERRVAHEGPDYYDREMQQAFRCEYSGALVADSVEVAEVRYFPLPEIVSWVQRDAAVFTPWFVEDLVEFGWL